MGKELVLSQRESFLPEFFEKGPYLEGDLTPSPLGLFATGVTKGAMCTFVPEMVMEGLERGGLSKPVNHVLTALTQVGMVFSMTPSYMPTATGMAVSGSLMYIGAPAPFASALGNTAAVATSLMSGEVPTPTSLAIAIGGGLFGSAIGLKAKHAFSSWLWSPENRERFAYVRDFLSALDG
jgi:hypothetical protein